MQLNWLICCSRRTQDLLQNTKPAHRYRNYSSSYKSQKMINRGGMCHVRAVQSDSIDMTFAAILILSTTCSDFRRSLKRCGLSYHRRYWLTVTLWCSLGKQSAAFLRTERKKLQAKQAGESINWMEVRSDWMCPSQLRRTSQAFVFSLYHLPITACFFFHQGKRVECCGEPLNFIMGAHQVSSLLCNLQMEMWKSGTGEFLLFNKRFVLHCTAGATSSLRHCFCL